MSQLKILQIGKFPETYPGGIEKAVFTLSKYLTSRPNISVEVVVNGFNKQEIVERTGNVKCTNFPQSPIIASCPINLSLFSFLKSLERNQRFDIIQLSLQNPVAVLSYLALKPKGKLVLWYHNDIVKQRISKFMFDPFLQRIIRRSAVVVATSNEYIKSSKYLNRLDGKVKCIPLGVDVSEFNKQNLICESRKLRKKVGRPIVLFMGRFVYYKGIEYLIKAIELVNAHLILAGDGPLELELRALVTALNLEHKVTFEKTVPYGMVGKFMHAADVLVLPSTCRTESFGMVLAEAMSCGKPVVTTELSTGTSYVCQDGVTGFVVPPKDPTAIRNAINKI